MVSGHFLRSLWGQIKNFHWGSRSLVLAILTLSGLAWVGASRSLADEGMWTFDNPPLKQLKERYGFTPTQEWLDHVRLSCVRFNDGGSGSFVSPNGLVLTNHHVAREQLQKISTPQKDYVKDGFYAKKQAEELKTKDLELNVLISTENVTKRVQGAAKPGMSQQAALNAQKAEIALIEKESLDATGLRSDVISLYQGASIGSIATRNTLMCAWSSRRNNRSLFSAVIPTTSLIRATIWIWRSFEFTKMISQSKAGNFCNGAPGVQWMMNWCLSPGIPVRLTVWIQLHSLKRCATPTTHKS